LVLVLILLGDLLGIVLSREIDAREVEALEQLDCLRVIVCLLKGIVQFLTTAGSMPFAPARPNGASSRSGRLMRLFA